MSPGRVLVFEIDSSGEILEVHADEEGLLLLQKAIASLRAQKDSHVHLFTPSWGGNELTEIPYDPEHRVIQKVTFYRYKPGFRDLRASPSRKPAE
ncbi:MAG TPA: Imm32 family immunity protein [Planctomycetota bacterium]|nr:Imm32 family immunity protein [Planctomycetota bacterium]